MPKERSRGYRPELIEAMQAVFRSKIAVFHLNRQWLDAAAILAVEEECSLYEEMIKFMETRRGDR